MKLKLTCTSFLILLCSISISGQNNFRDGFFVSTDGDTIRAEILKKVFETHFDEITLRIGQKVSKYHADQILGFGFDKGEKYSSQIVRGIFVEVLIVGKVSLYRNGTFYYIAKGENKSTIDFTPLERYGLFNIISRANVIKRVDPAWKHTLTSMVSDCIDNIALKLENLPPYERNLIRLVRTYNECSGEEFKQHVSDEKWTELKFGLYLGQRNSQLSFSDLSFNNDFLKEKYRSNGTSFGLGIQVSSPRLSHRFSFETNVLYYSQSFYSSTTENTPALNEEHQIFINTNRIEFPMMFSYNLRNSQPYVRLQAGISANYVQSSIEHYEDSIYDNIVITSFTDDFFTTRTVQNSIIFGISSSIKIKKIETAINLRVMRGDRFNTYNTFKAFDQDLMVGLTIYL